jgi:hypothetical protein
MNYKSFDGATYQIFAGFDCLPPSFLLASRNEPLTSLIYEDTPSADAAIATAPATVYRYLRPVNLLSDTPIDVIDGSVYLNDDDTLRSLLRTNFDWSDLKSYKIGVQRCCPVVLKPVLNYFQMTQNQAVVHQIFCGALDFRTVKRCQLTAVIAKSLLEAEYQATICAACENARLFPERPGARTLFLSLLGCSEGFDNPIRMVCGALLRSRELIEHCGLQIYLVCNDREFEIVWPKLQEMVEKLGGEVINTGIARAEEDLVTEQCSCGSRVVWCVLVFVLLLSALWFVIDSSGWSVF